MTSTSSPPPAAPLTTIQCITKGCKKRISIGDQCSHHLAKDWYLSVAPSHIQGGGLGLFTLRDIPKHTTIVEYKGHRHVSSDIEEDGGNYVLEYKPNHIIDPYESTMGFGRFVNDCRTINREQGECKDNNAEFTYDEKQDKVWVTSKRLIKQGEEIFIFYGRKYWNRLKNIGIHINNT